MGWTLRWFSSAASDFNVEFGVSSVVEVDVHRWIMFTWGWIGSPLTPGWTTVEICLDPDPSSGTRITFTHPDLPGGLLDLHRGG
jgi:hypothetical protein